MLNHLSEADIKANLRRVPEWKSHSDSISRRFEFADFAASMRFVHAVAVLAEAANHHPDIDIRWNKVLLQLSTHSSGGLTEADFALAEKIDTVTIKG